MLLSNIYQGSKTTVLQMAFTSQKNVWNKQFTIFEMAFGHWSARSGMGMLHMCKMGALEAFLPETDPSWGTSGVRRGQFGVLLHTLQLLNENTAHQSWQSLWKCQVNLHQDFKHRANRWRQALNVLQTLAPLSAVTKQRTFKTWFFSAWG